MAYLVPTPLICICRYKTSILPNSTGNFLNSTITIIWWPNMLILEPVAKRLKAYLIKQLIQAAEQAWYACPHQTCLIRACPNEQNIAHQTREQKKCFNFLIECLMAFKFYQTRPTRSNSTKQGGQTVKCLVTKQCLMGFGC